MSASIPTMASQFLVPEEEKEHRMDGGGDILNKEWRCLSVKMNVIKKYAICNVFLKKALSLYQLSTICKDLQWFIW